MLCSEIQGYPRNAEINSWYVFAKTGRGTESLPRNASENTGIWVNYKPMNLAGLGS